MGRDGQVAKNIAMGVTREFAAKLRESDSKEVREGYFKRELLEKGQMPIADQARFLKGEYKDPRRVQF